jgi:hypothetical protein
MKLRQCIFRRTKDNMARALGAAKRGGCQAALRTEEKRAFPNSRF